MVTSQKLLIATLCNILLTVNLHSQTVYPSPYVSINLSTSRLAVYEPLSVSWKCVDPESSIATLEYRYKLDAPGDWLGGIKYNINKWSSWIKGASNNVVYGDFILEGTYAISVQCRNIKTGRESKVSTSKFTVYWEYPALQEEAFDIDWEKVKQAETDTDKYEILAEEYRNAYLMWNRRFEVELRKLKLTGSSSDYIDIISSQLTEDGYIKLVESASKKSAKTISQILLPITIYEIIKNGAVDLILIYRNYETNKASTMTVASYHAWKRFEELAKNNPNRTSDMECPEFVNETGPIIKSLSKSEVIIGDIIELKGCFLTDANNNEHAWIMNSNGEKGCIWFEGGFTYESAKVRLEYKLCSGYNGLSGLPCDSWFYLDPGDYYIWVHTAFGKSNQVKFRVISPINVKTNSSSRAEKYVVEGTSKDKIDPFLNVRSGPGTDFPVIRKISDGSIVVVIEDNLGKDRNWAKIVLANSIIIGYVNIHYLRPYY